jgi:hypothetical protein
MAPGSDLGLQADLADLAFDLESEPSSGLGSFFPAWSRPSRREWRGPSR